MTRCLALSILVAALTAQSAAQEVPSTTATDATQPPVLMSPNGTAIEIRPVRRPAVTEPPTRRPTSPVAAGVKRPLADLEVGFRAFAAGDLDGSERMLTSLIALEPSPAAYLLRGCVRYTRAALSRNEPAMLDSARADFVEALERNPSLVLDPKVFSPRLIEFLNDVRAEQAGR